MSRLNGIMNIEAGVDGDHLVRNALLDPAQRAWRGHHGRTILLRHSNRWRNIYARPDQSPRVVQHAPERWLGPVQCQSRLSGTHARTCACCGCEMDSGIDVSLPDLASHHLGVNLGGQLNKQTEAGLLTVTCSRERSAYAEMLRKGHQCHPNSTPNRFQNPASLHPRRTLTSFHP